MHILTEGPEASAVLYDRCTGGSARAGAEERPGTQDDADPAGVITQGAKARLRSRTVSGQGGG
ncbi:hypothetical protein GCM10023075_32700 [Streptosporangium album]